MVSAEKSAKKRLINRKDICRKRAATTVFIRADIVARFDKFSFEKGASEERKQIIMDFLKTALQKNKAESTEIVHISLPLETAHKHHKISVESRYTRNICKEENYVSLGITSVPFLKKVLR